MIYINVLHKYLMKSAYRVAPDFTLKYFFNGEEKFRKVTRVKYMKLIFRFLLGAMLCGYLIPFAHAVDPEGGQPVELPVVVGKGSLTVAGQGYWYRKVYESGESPSLSAYDNNGALLPDGVYRYEFRSMPEDAGASQRQQNLTRSEGRGVSRGRGKAKGVGTVSGRFEIQGGEIIYR